MPHLLWHPSSSCLSFRLLACAHRCFFVCSFFPYFSFSAQKLFYFLPHWWHLKNMHAYFSLAEATAFAKSYIYIIHNNHPSWVLYMCSCHQLMIIRVFSPLFFQICVQSPKWDHPTYVVPQVCLKGKMSFTCNCGSTGTGNLIVAWQSMSMMFSPNHCRQKYFAEIPKAKAQLHK